MKLFWGFKIRIQFYASIIFQIRRFPRSTWGPSWRLLFHWKRFRGKILSWHGSNHPVVQSHLDRSMHWFSKVKIKFCKRRSCFHVRLWVIGKLWRGIPSKRGEGNYRWNNNSASLLFLLICFSNCILFFFFGLLCF
jgi:hypothetical protein